MHDSELPADDAARAKLEARLKTLAIPPQTGSAAAPDVFGKTYEFPANAHNVEANRLEKGANGEVTIVARVAGKEHRLECGNGKWIDGQAAWGKLHGPAAASGAWTSPDTYTAKLCFYETPFIVTVRFEFSGDELHLSGETNVGFGPAHEKTLVGKLSHTSPKR